MAIDRSHVCDRRYRRELKDAKGVFCCFVCDDCEDEKRMRYKPEIFEDAGYDHDEPLEEY